MTKERTMAGIIDARCLPEKVSQEIDCICMSQSLQQRGHHGS